MGGVEDAVDIGVAVHAATEQAPQEQGLDDDAADGPGRRHLRAGGDEVAGLADAEEGPVLLAHLLGADEVPPRDLLPDLLAAGVAAGQVDEEAVGEVGGLVGGEAGAEVQHREELVADPAEGEVAGAGRGGDAAEREVQVGAAAGAGEQGLGAADEVVVDAVRVAGDRDAAHGVRQVPVEAGEEAEAVLGGEVGAAAGRRARDGHRARLAAEGVVVLVDGDGVAAFGEFVGGAQAGDSASQDGDAFADRGPRAARGP
ncbi:hypothetical protein ABIE67_005456 [Streptomyces sp. V4I8]